MSTNDIPAGELVLSTHIPEGHAVQGLDYGRHVTTPGWSGYYVKPAGTDLPMTVARATPASDELEGDDAAIVEAITAEQWEALEAMAALREGRQEALQERRHQNGPVHGPAEFAGVVESAAAVAAELLEPYVQAHGPLSDVAVAHRLFQGLGAQALRQQGQDRAPQHPH